MQVGLTCGSGAVQQELRMLHHRVWNVWISRVPTLLELEASLMPGENFDMGAWDLAVSTLSNRAESLRDASSAFAQTPFLHALRTPKDQIIYGRRGAGKTHLSRRLAEEYMPEDFENHRTIAVQIDASGFAAGAYGPESIPQIAALDIFGQLIKRVANEVHTFLTKRLDPTLFERAFGTGKARQLTAAGQHASRLSRLVEAGEVHFLPMGEASQTTKSLRETATDVGARASANLTDPQSFGIQLGASVSGRRTTSQADLRTITISGRLYLPFTEIARVLRVLLDSILTKYLVIIIDEWSTIDFDVQPYLAQLLKRMRQGAPSSGSLVQFKLGCIPTRTQLSTRRPDSPIPIGLEEGDDIFPDVDLDRAAFFDLDDNDRLHFLRDLLRLHVAQSLSWVKEMNSGTFAEFLKSSVFESDDVYKELCWASAGVPRDFLDLMSKVTHNKMERHGRRIEFRDVRDVASLLFDAKRNDIPARSLTLNTEVYMKVVSPNKSYPEFLLSTELASIPEVKVIWAERLWHRSPEPFVDGDTGASYQRYRIDYGMYVDLIRTKKVNQPWYVAIGSKGVAAGAGSAIVGVPALVAFGPLGGLLGSSIGGTVGWNVSKQLTVMKLRYRPIARQGHAVSQKVIADSVVNAFLEGLGRGRPQVKKEFRPRRAGPRSSSSES